MTTGEVKFVDRPEDFEAAFGTPLIEFWGTVHSVEMVASTQQPGKYRVKVNCIDVEVIKAETEYNLPVATLDISYSTRQNSPWYAFSKSAVEKGLKGGRDVAGKRCRFLRATRTREARAGETGSQPRAWIEWTVAEIKGQTEKQVNILDEVKKLLHGKTAAEFAQAAFQSEAVRGDAQVKDGILSGALLSGLVAAGEAEMDGDKYWIRGWERK